MKFALSEEVNEKRVNIEAISRRISHILSGFLDYYAVPGVVSELEEVKRVGDKLAEEEVSRKRLMFIFYW